MESIEFIKILNKNINEYIEANINLLDQTQKDLIKILPKLLN